jgi:hypothetical protein
MGWLSGHEPQLRIVIGTYKRQDGEGLGANKVGEGSGENIPKPPKTHHKNDFPPKPNHLRNRLDTTPAPPVFPPQTNDFQKLIKFVSTSGKVFFGKESEKASEEKPVEKLSGEKPSEQPKPKPKPKLVRFHCSYCGRDGHMDEFCFKRKREERMTKEWSNKDKYHPSNGVLESRVQMPRAKASVRIVPTWGERKAVGGAVGRATPVRPVRGTGQTGEGWIGSRSGFVLVQVRGLALEVVVLVVGLESLQEVSLLGVLPLVLNMGMGGFMALRWRGGTVHGTPFVVLVLLQVERVGSLILVTVVVFVEVALDGKMFWIVLTPLLSKWLGTGFTLLVLTLVLSSLFAHVLVFEFEVGDLKSIWLIDSGCSRHMTGDKGWFSSLVPVVTKRYITFGDNGRGRVLSEGEIKVSDKITLRRVALIQSLGYKLLSMSQLLDEAFKVLFRPGGSRILDYREDLVCMVIPEGQVFRADFSQSFGVERCFLAGSSSELWKWHRKLGHLSFDLLFRLSKLKMVRGLPRLRLEKELVCAPCKHAKMVASSHPLSLM